MTKKSIAFGILGSVMDRASRRRGRWEQRWEKWRPTVALFQQRDLVIDEFYLLYNDRDAGLVQDVANDIRELSPLTQVLCTPLNFDAPWDLASVYLILSTFLKQQRFSQTHNDYYFHITTGSHIQQICVFLATEARLFPGKLLQSSPKLDAQAQYPVQIIDLDLSRYDEIASRFKQEHLEGTAYLKAGIQTRNKAFNDMIAQIEKVAIQSRAPMLITGPTGAGKSHLARRIYALKKLRSQVEGAFVEINCATLRGDNAMSALFGHSKGAFTGAASAREGLLKSADRGVLFLDEIGELGPDEQAMLLRAIEDKQFLPLGSDRAVHSEFQLIAGTNRDLRIAVRQGVFRDDLLARINLWVYQLPGLKERKEDLEPNLDYELALYAQQYGLHVTFSSEARREYLTFALSANAQWTGNFRDLNASVTRMSTLCEGGRITSDVVKNEIRTLQYHWGEALDHGAGGVLDQLLLPHRLSQLDYIEKVQLEGVIQVCRQCTSAAEAGRRLYDVSRLQKASNNDSHRLAVYLKKYGLSFEAVRDA